MDATVSDSGTLEGKVEFSARGDLEYMLRVAFRSVPMPQWKELVQRISATFGFGGEVSEVTASIPEETDEPFRIAYKYTRKEYADWPNRRILAPAPVIGLPSPPEDGQTFTVPLLLGAPTDIDLQGRIQLPKGYTPSVPEAIHLKTDFAEYDATYSFKDGSLISDRHYRSLTLEVPQKFSAEYKKFNKAVLDDYITYIPLFSGTKPVKSDAIADASSVMSRAPYRRSPGPRDDPGTETDDHIAPPAEPRR